MLCYGAGLGDFGKSGVSPGFTVIDGIPVLGREKGRMGIVQRLKEALDLSDGLLHIVRVVNVCRGLLQQGISVEAKNQPIWVPA